MPQWFERTDLSVLLDLDSLTEKRLLGALDYLEGLDAESWQQQMFESVCRHYRLHLSGVVYDVTNTYLYGSSSSLGRLGKDKEGVKGRPLIQIGMAVTQEESLPLFHKVFDGNVHDSRTLHDLVTSSAANLVPAAYIAQGLLYMSGVAMYGKNQHSFWLAKNYRSKSVWTLFQRELLNNQTV